MAILGAIGSAVAGGAMGLLSSKMNNKYNKEAQIRNFEQNKEMMGISQKYQKEMYDYTYDKENASAQVEQLKKAGLSPGLMYGLGGIGGSTGSSGGSVGGQAPSQIDLGGGAMMGLQAKLNMDMQKAQVENINADTEVKKEQAQNTAKDTEVKIKTIDQIAQDTENANIQNHLMRIDRDIKANDLERGMQELNRMKRENKIGDDTYNAVVDGIFNQTALSRIEKEVKVSQINVNQQQIEKLANEITQGWANIKINQQNANTNSKNADTNKGNLNVNQFKEKIKADYPSLSNTLGKAVDRVLEALWNAGNEITDSTENYKSELY